MVNNEQGVSRTRVPIPDHHSLYYSHSQTTFFILARKMQSGNETSTDCGGLVSVKSSLGTRLSLY